MFATYFFIYSLIFRCGIFYILTKKHDIAIFLFILFLFYEVDRYSFWTIRNEYINIDGSN